MKVAVVTPYYKETDAVLWQCHESVLAQTAPCDHFMVADGHERSLVDGWKASHFKLPFAHGDNGNTPRVFGGLSAFNLGYDAVAFLDADNWFRADHIERMIKLATKSGAVFCSSNRKMHRPDGSYMFEDDLNDGENHIDTSCMFLLRPTMPQMARWSMMPKQLGPVCDTVYFSTIKTARLSRAHDPSPTVHFRTTYEADFARLGEPNPEGVKTRAMTMSSFDWWRSRSLAERRRIRKELGWPAPLPKRAYARLRAWLKAVGNPAPRKSSGKAVDGHDTGIAASATLVAGDR